MKIIVAETAGFCWGVRRAMERTLHIAYQKHSDSVQTLGPLIHNTQVVEFLESKGITRTDTIDHIQDGTVIIRAHGTTPEILKTLKERQIDICNATCPKVGKVQAIIKKYKAKNFNIIISGDNGHAEVISLLAYAGGNAHLIQTVEQAQKLPHFEKAVLVSQTTFDESMFHKIADALRHKVDELDVFSTICDSTHRRQEEVKKIANQVDCMIIVGGKHSANTRRLADISEEYCSTVYHIETEGDLADVDISLFDSVGISAGASTPNWIIRAVVQYVRFKSKKRSVAFNLYNWFFNAGLYRSLAAFFLSVGILQLLKLPFNPYFPIISFLYLFSISNINAVINLNAVSFNEPIKYHFLHSHKKTILGLSVLSLCIIAGLMPLLSLPSICLVILAVALGVLYRIKIPLVGKSLRIFDIPGSKNLLHGLAWSLVIAGIPILESIPHKGLPWLIGPALVFMIVFSGSILFDIKDTQGDQFCGKETLPTLVGPSRTALIASLFVFVISCFLIVASATTANFPLLCATVITTGYILLCLWSKQIRSYATSSGTFELLVDGTAFLPVLTCFIYSLL